MNEEKSLFPQIIWDILAMNFAMMLSTVNSLTYVFTIASVILLYPVYKDIKKYKGDKTFNRKKYILLMVLATISTLSLCVLISLVATNNIILTYTLYATASPVLLVTIIFAIKDSVNNRKNKTVEKVDKEEKIDFVVEEMGTSIDRENKENNISSDAFDLEQKTSNDDNNLSDKTSELDK